MDARQRSGFGARNRQAGMMKRKEGENSQDRVQCSWRQFDTQEGESKRNERERVRDRYSFQAVSRSGRKITKQERERIERWGRGGRTWSAFVA